MAAFCSGLLDQWSGMLMSKSMLPCSRLAGGAALTCGVACAVPNVSNDAAQKIAITRQEQSNILVQAIGDPFG